MEPSEISRIRKKLGLSEQDFADMFGLDDPRAVASLENGERPPSKTKALMLNLLDSLPKDEAHILVAKMLD